jgi:hypothetical protein
MKIGLIGAGQIGGTLTRRFTALGHEVFVANSRGPERSLIWPRKPARPPSINGARKAGLPDCVPADKLKDMPNLIHVKSCDGQRAKIAG